MAEVRFLIDGEAVTAFAGSTVAAVLLGLGKPFRRSAAGEPRAALCGMGTCFECRVTIDGRPHERACLVACREGMEVLTGG